MFPSWTDSEVHPTNSPTYSVPHPTLCAGSAGSELPAVATDCGREAVRSRQDSAAEALAWLVPCPASRRNAPSWTSPTPGANTFTLVSLLPLVWVLTQLVKVPAGVATVAATLMTSSSRRGAL